MASWGQHALLGRPSRYQHNVMTRNANVSSILTQTPFSTPYLKYKIYFTFFFKERLLKTEPNSTLGFGNRASRPGPSVSWTLLFFFCNLAFFNDVDNGNQAWLAPQATAFCIAWEVVLNKCYTSMLGSQRDSHIPWYR